MKVTVISPTGERITRYGVGDFQTNDDESVTLFYPPRVFRATAAPDEERLDGAVSSAVDSAADDEWDYRMEDLETELQVADDVMDYRIDSGAHETVIPSDE